jgi:two-component sensor histidine kinase
MSWRESGGPPVSPPTRRGFGTRMIEGLARDLDGTADLEFNPGGLVCRIRAPFPDDRA